MPTRIAPLAAALAVLALAAALAAPRAAAEEPADAEAASTVTTLLRPGWNMAAWLGEDAPVQALFDAVPELDFAMAWDAETQRERRARPRSIIRDGLTRLTTGMGLYLLVDGDAPVEWTREAAPGSVLLELREGRNRVGWTGRDGAPAAEALARFGDSLVAASRWNAETQRYERYRPGAAEEANTLRALRRGDALEVELTSDARWWQSGTAGTKFEFLGGVPEQRQAEIRAETAEVLAFYAERYGIVPPEFSLVFDTGVDNRFAAYATPGQITIGCCLSDLGGTITHEYTHILQFYFNDGNLHVPQWIVEGHATYVDALFTQARGTTGGNYSRAHWRRLALPVKSLQDDFAVYWGPNIYSLSALAMEWLVVHAETLDAKASDIGASGAMAEPPLFGALSDHGSHIRFWMDLAHSEHWQEAFAKAFGLTVEDFYGTFESYRADRLARLAPNMFDDRVEPLLIFVGEVPADTRRRIRSEIQQVHRIFNERFAAATVPSIIDITIFAGNDSQALATTHLYVTGLQISPDFCSSYGLRVAIIATSCEVSVEHYVSHYHTRLLNHHYLGSFLISGGAFPPLWLELGIDAYATIVYRTEAGIESFEAARRRALSPAIHVTQPLDGMQTRADVDAAGPRREGVRALGFLAVEQLVRRAGEPALFEYYEALADATNWRDPFKAAFGIAPDAFYAEFETYRAETIARIVPHQFDHREGPTLVFLGDVPNDIRSRMKANLDRVHRFYTERFETIPADISIFVGTDAESVAEQYRLVWGHEPHREFCSIGGGGTVFVVVAAACHAPLHQFERPYFQHALDLLAPGGSLPEVPDGHHPLGPLWLVLGTNDYTYYAYRVLAGADTLERVRNEQISRASRTAAPLSSLQTHADADDAGGWEARALGFLAAERLVARAGEPALFEYYAALPDAADWREAFEAAFGLSADAFYADFEAYRARVAPPADGAP